MHALHEPVLCFMCGVGVDRLSAPILSIFTIIDIGHLYNLFSDFFFIIIIFFYYANKHTNKQTCDIIYW